MTMNGARINAYEKKLASCEIVYSVDLVCNVYRQHSWKI